MKMVAENCDYKQLMYWLGGNTFAKRKSWEGTFFENSHIERRNALYRKYLLTGKLFDCILTHEEMNARDWIIFEKD